MSLLTLIDQEKTNMPFHFCADELFMLLAMLPFIGVFFRKFHVWWHAKVNHAQHSTRVIDVETRSPEEVVRFAPTFRPPHVELVSENDMQYLQGTPAPIVPLIKVDIDEQNP